MVPADERLQAENLAGAEVGDGLILEAELTGADSDGQIGFQGGAADHGVVHLGVEELIAALAAAFGHVHGEVGASQQFGGHRRSRAASEQRRCSPRQPVRPSDDERRPYGVEDPPGHFDGGGAAVVLGDDNGEFVAARRATRS